MSKNQADEKRQDPPKDTNAQPVLVKPTDKDKISSCQFDIVITADGDATVDILNSKGKAVTQKVNGAKVFGTITLPNSTGTTVTHTVTIHLCGSFKAGDFIRIVICTGASPSANCVSYRRDIDKDLECGACGDSQRTYSIVKQLRDLGYDQIIVGIHD